ncbi:MAG: EAL domain-containing protein, partial [Herminiimonas sp.]|nr:EAL domain-containing protein [Herminiimonas sp.]
VRLVIALARTLNLETVAEGIETAAHVEELRRMGCFIGQGYFFSPPVSADDAALMLAPLQAFLVNESGSVF